MTTHTIYIHMTIYSHIYMSTHTVYMSFALSFPVLNFSRLILFSQGSERTAWSQFSLSPTVLGTELRLAGWLW